MNNDLVSVTGFFLEAIVTATSVQFIPQHISEAFKLASSQTGTSFDFLLRTAVQESGLDNRAEAKTSSATGMFQFIESTWLESVKRDGPKLGYGHYADMIAKDDRGNYVVNDPTAREKILDLRHDTVASAKMAAAYAARNANYLESRIGRSPSEGELYMAHFLGAGGASKLINLAEQAPNASAAGHFQAAAKANKSIFYNENQQPRSLSEVYEILHEKGTGSTKPSPTPVVAHPFTANRAGLDAWFKSNFSNESEASNTAVFNLTSYRQPTASPMSQAYAEPIKSSISQSFSDLFTNIEPTVPEFDWKRGESSQSENALLTDRVNGVSMSSVSQVGKPLNLLAFTGLFKTEPERNSVTDS